MRLRTALLIPFILFILIAIGTTGYISLNSSQQAVNDVATQLCSEITAQIQQHIQNYLSIPHLITRINADAIQLGLLDLEEPTLLERHFWKQIRNFGSVGNIYIGNPAGGIILAGREAKGGFYIKATEDFKSGDYFVYATDETGERAGILKEAPPYDARTRPWYEAAVQGKQAVWSDIYPFFTGETLGISASQPVYDNQGLLLGVLAIDLFLAQISDFLQGLTVGQSGHTFIMERSGAIVASSSTETPFKINAKNQAQERLLAMDSQEPLTAVTAAYLLTRFDDFTNIDQVEQLNFESEGANHFLQVTPLVIDQQIDWLIVVVIPESDFFAPIYQNRQITIWVLVVAAGATIFIGLLAVQRFTQPILALNCATQGIARGEWVKVQPKGMVKEVNQLANSFNQMTEQLQSSFSALQQANFELQSYQEQLEEIVKERTSELAMVNRQLQKDIVKRKKAEEEAKAANRATSIFLANMSHELRTPLNSVLGYTQLLKREVQSDKNYKRLSIVEQSSEHLLQLINDVLDIAKVESGKILLHKTEFHFRGFLDNVCDLAKGSTSNKSLRFHLEILPSDPTSTQKAALPIGVYGDEKRLRQVLINLLSNAIKFTDQGDIILRLYVGEQDDTIRFEVSDTGLGIPQENLQRIFEPFEQSENSQHSIEGTGLGLSISQKLVNLMGGTLQVTSQLGQGSTFWFQLPLPPVTSFMEQSSVDGRKVVGVVGKAPTVLIVDDLWENRAVLAELLSSVGVEIYEARDGVEGLALAEQLVPDALIADLVMPKMDGFEMIRQLRQMPRLHDIVIIATSASVLDKDENYSLIVGSDRFLPKPVKAEDIFEQLEVLLDVEWLYESDEMFISSEQDSSNFILPPAEELAYLSNLAQLGDVEAVQLRMIDLQQDSHDYALFLSELQYWLRLSEINRVQKILTSYLEKSRDDISS